MTDCDCDWQTRECLAPLGCKAIADAYEVKHLASQCAALLAENRTLRAELAAERERCAKLERLIQILLDEDPNDLAADGGVTVLDVWRKDARRAIRKGE